MARNVPPRKGWESYADAQIRGAMERGAFDNLPGTGKPIPGLDEPYDENWWLKGLLKREGLSLLPETLQRRVSFAKDLDALKRLTSEADVRRRVAELNATIAALNARVAEGPALDLPALDVEKVVHVWRAGRGCHFMGAKIHTQSLLLHTARSI